MTYNVRQVNTVSLTLYLYKLYFNMTHTRMDVLLRVLFTKPVLNSYAYSYSYPEHTYYYKKQVSIFIKRESEVSSLLIITTVANGKVHLKAVGSFCRALQIL